jgi:hypothetical protein
MMRFGTISIIMWTGLREKKYGGRVSSLTLRICAIRLINEMVYEIIIR